MHRLFLLFLLMFAIGLPASVAAQAGAADELPPRPTPFRFVNDQAQLLAPADAKKLENGLRRYADNTGTQVVVVTVPNLGGREVANYGRALGTAWGVGQRNKNNGLVVLLSAQERKVTIQPGSGLASTITPAVTSRVIGEMTAKFKQGNYFAGLRTGLNTLMATANPGSAPKNNPSAEATSPTPASVGAANGLAASGAAETSRPQNEPAQVPSTDPLLASPPTEPVSSGPGMGTVLVGALLVGGLLWLLVRMFRRRSPPSSAPYAGAPSSAGPPNFLPNRTGPGGYSSGGGYGSSQGPDNYGGTNNSGGMGMGSILATGAAAAAGAYLGNRLASGHETSGNSFAGDGTGSSHFDPATTAGAAGADAMGTGAAEDYFASRSDADNTAPDYFSNDDSADNSSTDYFSSDDNSSYDDLSGDDTGGGGFDSGDDNSGSW
ncbi:TPM domain-containing protein [Hymenobacter sp. BT664]|uniref:TPM domain-containing protein n=1 Tax=Hymenobacter montanus TaxID=2771359 RepID=A0A927BHH5_9BACT|nr:TPM domain-containing protein [Hymenobacter montanus]MBD2770148.1 TPM domain-containing protein [Hymenobacter montanus]